MKNMKLKELLKYIVSSEMVRGFTLNGDLLFCCEATEVDREYYDEEVVCIESAGVGYISICLYIG